MEEIITLMNELNKILKDVNNRIEYLPSKENFSYELLAELKKEINILEKNIEKDLFDIKIFKNNGIVIVYSLSYVSPFIQKERIEKILKDEDFKGQVIFDSLLAVGNSNNRFLKLLFLGEKLEDVCNSPIFLTKEEFFELRDFLGLNNFYKENGYLLEHNNILSRAEKFLVKNDYL